MRKRLKNAEMSEWFKEHDWKSCVRLKRTGGSNPLLCATKKGRIVSFLFLWDNDVFEEDLRVGGVLREQNGLPYTLGKSLPVGKLNN